MMCILKAGPSVGPNPVTGKGIPSSVAGERKDLRINVAKDIDHIVSTLIQTLVSKAYGYPPQEVEQRAARTLESSRAGNREGAGSCTYPSRLLWSLAIKRWWTSSQPIGSGSSHAAVYSAVFLLPFFSISFVKGEEREKRGAPPPSRLSGGGGESGTAIL